MAIIKYNRPNTDLISRNFNDIVDEFFNQATSNYKRDSFVPSVDISESEKQFMVSVELPGVKKEDINVNIEKSNLTISGERKLNIQEEGKNFHRVEAKYGKFSRTFYLPDSINEDSIKAKYEDGILTISIDKSEEKLKKQIEIL